jgi:hypothetical membrane protein
MKIKESRQIILGGFFWILNIQYYLVQFIVAKDWPKSNGYSLSNNTISDLANTHCGSYGARLVCSPLHIYMNISFIILGLTIILGAVLLRKYAVIGFYTKTGLICLIFSGLGGILVGLFPENVAASPHVLGASLSFGLGNIGLLLLGYYGVKFSKYVRGLGLVFGLIGLLASILFISHSYLGLGIGGMERIASYPQSIWMIVAGSSILMKVRATNSK